MQLIDGKQTAATIKAEIKAEVEDIVSKGGKRPHLAAILVGHDGGSETYVRNKVLACEACGFQSTLLRFEDDITEEEIKYNMKQMTERYKYEQGSEMMLTDLLRMVQASMQANISNLQQISMKLT